MNVPLRLRAPSARERLYRAARAPVVSGAMGAEAAWRAWLEGEVDDRVVGIRDATSPWSKTTVTSVVTLAARRPVVVQCSMDAPSLELRRRVSERVARFAPSLGVPPVVAHCEGTLVTEWVDGPDGAALLGDARGARTLALALGRAAATVRSVPAEDLGLPAAWSDRARLAAAVAAWEEDAAQALDPATRRRLDSVTIEIADAATGAAALAHGDLVPVNIRIREVSPTILDWEDATLAIPMFDLAWTRWVVGRHHPVAWRLMEAPCLEAAGFAADTGTLERLDRLAIARCLQRVAHAVRARAPHGRELASLREAIQLG